MCAPNIRWRCIGSIWPSHRPGTTASWATNILGRGFNFDIELVEGAGAFVCGEETALISSLEGQPGRSRPRPPYPAQKGLWGHPTNINNVETWFNIPPIIAKGPAWFTEIGSEASPGTKVFSLVGKVMNTGLVEMPLGTPLSKFVYDVGGGGMPGHNVKAVQTGGPSGGCIPHEMFDTPVDYESLGKLGSIMGSGGMVVMDDDNCMVDVARYFIEFTRSESCGKCMPCRVGLDKALRTLTRITKGEGREEDLDELDELGRMIRDTSLCGLGQSAPELGAHRDAPFPPRIRGPHPREALPRRRLPGSGTGTLREQLSAAHEHSALPATVQGRASGGRVRVGHHGQPAAGFHRPRLPASLREPLPPADGGRADQHARGAPRHRGFRSCCRTGSTRWRPRSSPSGFPQREQGSPWSAPVRRG